VFDLTCMHIGAYDGITLYQLALNISKHVAYLLPHNTDPTQLVQLASLPARPYPCNNIPRDSSSCTSPPPPDTGSISPLHSALGSSQAQDQENSVTLSRPEQQEFEQRQLICANGDESRISDSLGATIATCTAQDTDIQDMKHKDSKEGVKSELETEVPPSMEIEKNCFLGKVRMITAYYGELSEYYEE